MNFKVRLLIFLLACSLLVLAAWLVDAPRTAQADEIPEKYRAMVHKGLEYLAKHQHKDGHWEGDAGKHPVAMTGLVGLALVMERERPNRRGFGRTGKIPDPKYLANIRKAADWLVEKSPARREGLIFSDHPSETARYMEGHGLATLFLAGAYALEEDETRQKKLLTVLNNAVKYIAKAQSTQGGWYHTSKVEGHDFDDVMATVIQIQALQAAANSGIPVPNEVLNHARGYLAKTIGKFEDKANPGKGRNRAMETAAALACYYNGNQFEADTPFELTGKWFKFCQAEIPVGRAVQLGRDELTHYYFAQVVFSKEGARKDYRTAMFDHLLSRQSKEGSWPAGDGIGVGAVYSTAVWCTVLQLDKRSHPSVRQIPVLVD